MMRQWSSMEMVSVAPMVRATSSEAARDRDDARTGAGGEAGEQGAEKADADDGDRLAGLDAAAAEDVDGTAERLAGEGAAGDGRRERDDGVGGGEVVLGIGVVGEDGDALAEATRPPHLHQGCRSCPSPRGRGRRGRWEAHPVWAGPGAEVGGAHTAALKADAHLAGAGVGAWNVDDADLPWSGQNCGSHRAISSGARPTVCR